MQYQVCNLGVVSCCIIAAVRQIQCFSCWLIGDRDLAVVAAINHGWLLVIKDSEAGHHCVGDDRLWLTRWMRMHLCMWKVLMRKVLPTVTW